MSAVVQESNVKVIEGMASNVEWCDAGPGIQIKVLAIDADNHSVQYLARTGPGHNAGVHRHEADAYIYIIDGSVKNLTTGCEFGVGDFCFQPIGDVHEEEAGPEGVFTYVSQRGDSDLLIEFMDESGAVADKYCLSDFAKLM
ncbi:MAG: anti-sigma factor ChrR (cupin superfamily) [Gammaproteobacteria bacterium]|jgi:anti-sigma factor ChrR (cupin superfamily)